MKLRFRLFAAFFAVLGLLAVSAEGSWAAACAVEVETESATSAGTHGERCSSGAAVSLGDEAGMPLGHDSGAPHCPAMPMGAAGACGAAAALPSDAPSPLIAPTLEARLSPVQGDLRELLLAVAVFHPPIA
jgi:hypothetical protein